MKTDDLIRMMAEDAPVPMRLGRAMTLALVIGAAVSIAVLILTIGIRQNMMQAIETARVLFKISVTLVLAIVATSLVFRIGRPGVSLKARGLSLVVPVVLLAAAVLIEMMMTPSDGWATRMVGRYSRFCVFFIPILSLAPLIGFMIVLREAAPDDPGLAGAVAGLAASGIAAAIYAWHCPDDSPFFIATWYTLAIAIVTAIGYFAGRRILRW